MRVVLVVCALLLVGCLVLYATLSGGTPPSPAPRPGDAPRAGPAAGGVDREEASASRTEAPRRGAEIRGRVVRASNGAPVEGAVAHAARVSVDGVLRGRRRAESDAAGLVRFAGIPPGETAVVVSGGGWFSEGLGPAADLVPVWVPREGFLEVELPVVPAATVAGVVTAADGMLVEGAEVRCEMALDPRDIPPFLYGTYGMTAAADASGRFRLAGLLPGSLYEIEAESPGHPQAEKSRFRAGDATELRIVFPPAFQIEVHVVERGTGRPLTGVSVACGWQAHAVTDARGRALVGPLAAGEHLVRANPERHLAPEPVRVVVGEPMSPLLFELTPGASIAGRLVLPDGSAPQKGIVEIERRQAQTDVEGRFEFHGLRPGPYDLGAAAICGETEFVGGAVVRTGEDDVVVRLEEWELTESWSNVFTVRVLGPDGRPVPEAFTEISGHLRWIEDGELPVPLSFAGKTLLVAHARDGAGFPIGAGAALVALPEDPPSDGFTVRLPPEETVAGRVLDQCGEPVVGVRVLAVHGGHDVHGVARTLADGSFLIGGMGDLEYRLRLEVPPEYRAPEPVPVVPGARDVEVKLERGISPVITVLDPEAAPVAGARVDISVPIPHGGWKVVAYDETDASGVAAFAALLPAEEYWLAVRPPALRPGLAGVERRWEPVEELTVRLERMWAVRGTVVDWTGKSLPGISVWRRGRRGLWARERTDAEGAFRFERLQADAIDLVAGDAAGELVKRGDLASLTVRVERGAEPVRLVVPAESCLVLAIPGLSGGAAPDLRTEEGRLEYRGLPQRDGTFLFTGLVPGRRCDAWLRLPDRHLVAYRAGLEPGGRATLELAKGTDLTGRCVGEGVTSYEDLEVVFRARGREVAVVGALDGTFTVPCLPVVEGEVEAEIVGSIPDDLLKGRARAVPGRPVEVRLTPVN